ncbi:MFS transporter [Paenibacillus sp. GSMTC-2017]|uniref:MFS transporter n=1 Tax=Paenibacillus sp. GSMTC-2017 TaxID=2794350 RepID=UPI0018D64473|nr:MFS transporter [Paenibacillus sp. GSMTC-2017]MBH5319603.1 MFS transporter [Paenibacillus sp. GSMTC-2017]
MDTQALERTGQKLMTVMVFTLILSMMSALMFTVVLPDISKEFNLSIAQVSWFSSAYSLIYAIGTVTYGKLADRFKLKNLLTFGLLMFALGSIVGLVSQTFELALLGRCLQSLGAAAIPATAMLIPIRFFTPERRGSALGMSAVGLALGSALGPVMSFFILSFAHWRWLFAVPVLIVLTIPFYRKYLGDDGEKTTGKFDWIGGGLLGAAIALLLMSVTNLSWSFMIGGILSLLLFIVRIRLAADPFVQPALFRNSKYTLALPITFILNGMGIALSFVTPLLLSSVQKLPASWIGFVLVPAAVATAFLGRKGGKIADSKGNSFLFYMSSGLLVLSFILLSTFTGSSPLFIALFLIFGNVGQSFIHISLSNAVSRTLSKEQAGVGMGLFFMLNFISHSIATGIFSKVVAMGSNTSWNPVNSQSSGFVFSNIFFIIAGLQIVTLVFYYYQFGRAKSKEVQLQELKTA